MRLLLRFSLPMLVGNIFQQFYSMVDAMIVGRFVGVDALAAVGATGGMSFLVLGFVIGLANGFCVVVSQRFGARDEAGLRRCVAMTMLLSLIVTAVATAASFLGTEPMLRAMNTPENIFSDSAAYIGIIFLGLGASLFYNLFSGLLRAVGDSKTPLYFLCLSSALNVVLDLLFVVTFSMGVAGAAWATIISQFAGFCLLLAGCTRGATLHIHISRVQLKWSYFKLIIQGGLPSLARQSLASVATICLNHAAMPYGDAAIAAMGVVQRITTFGASAMIGFGQGFQPVCGFNYGARLYHRVKEGFWFCVKVAAVFLLVIGALGFAFAPQLIALFRDDPEVIAIGTVALRFQCVTFFFQAWITMSNMMLQTIGRTVPATFVAMARQGIFFIPLVWLLSLSPLGLLGVQMAQSVSDLLTLAAAVPIQLYVLRQMSQMQPAKI